MTDTQASQPLAPQDPAPITEITDEMAKPDGLAPVRSDSPTFTDLGARPETVDALAASGITRAFAIQEYALPIAIRGADLIGQAPTGTGKTLGFGVPLLERLSTAAEGADGRPQALVVVPTRELCLQVARDLKMAGSTRGVRVLAIYGGVAYEPQTDALKRGVEIVVGTPGRLLDLANGKQLTLAGVHGLVLDEADRMLDLGFLEDVEKLIAMTPSDRQTMLFSATMPDPIVALARRFMRSPITIHAGHTDATGPSPQTQQVIYRTHSLNKLEIVARILQANGRGLTMIFTRTKRNADRVAADLDFRGFAVGAVHGDLGQGARERALRAFRTGKVDVLVATDVAARGLDVTGVTHVINYDCPEDPDTYTHRIGRTGRAGATGVAVTFVDWEDMPRWRLIDKSLGLDLPEPPETYHTSPWLYSDLDIPTDVTGTLPTDARTRAGLSAEKEEDLGGGRRDRGPAPARGRGRTGREGGRRTGGTHGRHASDGGPRTGEDEVTADADATRAPRQRRRTRRVDEATSSTGTAAVDTAASGPETPEAAATRRPRRRRRGGRSSGTGPTEA
jgi:superfamily II DNA/RNA helicase